jgi:hypothetical protein
MINGRVIYQKFILILCTASIADIHIYFISALFMATDIKKRKTPRGRERLCARG